MKSTITESVWTQSTKCVLMTVCVCILSHWVYAAIGEGRICPQSSVHLIQLVPRIFLYLAKMCAVVDIVRGWKVVVR
jgi:hypothetical protein